MSINYWVFCNFKNFASRTNIHLLREDIKFIESIIKDIAYNEQRVVLSNYLKKWEIGMVKGKKTPHDQNMGRLEANTWLLSKKVN